MLATFATLAFLATLWLVAVILADMAAQSGGKIRAALKGVSLLAAGPSVRPVAVRVSQRSRTRAALRARPRLRAAA